MSTISDTLTRVQSLPRHKAETDETRPIRKAYTRQLSSLYTKLFSHKAEAFDGDAFIQYALAIANHNGFSNYYGIRQKLLPFAERHVRRLNVLETELLKESPNENKIKEALEDFVASDTLFSRAFVKVTENLLKDTPHIYKHKSYPKTVALFEKVYRQAVQEKDTLKSQLENSDFAIFETITDLTILHLISSEEEIPEAFVPFSAQILKLRNENSIDVQALREKILWDKKLEKDSQATYTQIGLLRTQFQRSHPKVYATLMHTLHLDQS